MENDFRTDMCGVVLNLFQDLVVEIWKAPIPDRVTIQGSGSKLNRSKLITNIKGICTFFLLTKCHDESIQSLSPSAVQVLRQQQLPWLDDERLHHVKARGRQIGARQLLQNHHT